jgi:hypothetical protein
MLKSIIIFSMLIQQVIASSLHVTVVDQSGSPMPGVPVTLDLYFYSYVAPDQMEVRGAFSDGCTTDDHGRCVIVIGETDTILRGYLDLGEYGGRDVFWPGGELSLTIRIEDEKIKIGREAAPYELQEKDDSLIVRRIPWVWIIAILFTSGMILTWLYLQSRREHS